MYDGVFGPPDFLRPLINWDGEYSYDRKYLEMLVSLVIIEVFLFVIYIKWKGIDLIKRRQSRG